MGKRCLFVVLFTALMLLALVTINAKADSWEQEFQANLATGFDAVTLYMAQPSPVSFKSFDNFSVNSWHSDVVAAVALDAYGPVTNTLNFTVGFEGDNNHSCSFFF